MAGEWALITGASSGIGLALAQQLADEKWNLVLTARRGEALQAFAKAHPETRIEVVAADLEQPTAAAQVFAFTERLGIRPRLLINNAGFGDFGRLQELHAERQAAMVQVNCSAVVSLTCIYLPQMIEQRAGDILIVASTASFQGLPYQVTYAATKAFDLIFAEGLAREVETYGIRVCAVCPGQTTTGFHAAANEPIPASMTVHSAEYVARFALKSLRAGKHYAIVGFRNRLGAQMQRFVPRGFVTRITERMFRPR